MRDGDNWSYSILRDPEDAGYYLGIHQERRIREQLFPAIKRAMAGTGSTVYTQHLSLDRYRLGDPNLGVDSSGENAAAMLDALFPFAAAAAELPVTGYDIATNTLAAAGADVNPTSGSMTFSPGGSIDKMLGAYEATQNPFLAVLYASPAGSAVEAMDNARTGDAIVFDGNQLAGTVGLSTEERWQQGLLGVGGAFGMAAGVGSPMSGWSFRSPSNVTSYHDFMAQAQAQLRASRRTTDLGMVGMDKGSRPVVPGTSQVAYVPRSPMSAPLGRNTAPGEYLYTFRPGSIDLVPTNLKHPYILGMGMRARGAGEIIVGEGQAITYFDDASGHFRIPGATYFDEMTGLLQELGFSVSRPGDSIYGN